MQPDDKLCYCFHVTKRKVENFIRIHQPSVPSQISECGGAGTGCGWCVPFLKRCFEAAENQQSDFPTAEEYESARTTYIRNGKQRD
ncbi:MAG: (2Fe-2S)-binding protein [Fuerstiella sp.]